MAPRATRPSPASSRRSSRPTTPTSPPGPARRPPSTRPTPPPPPTPTRPSHHSTTTSSTTPTPGGNVPRSDLPLILWPLLSSIPRTTLVVFSGEAMEETRETSRTRESRRIPMSTRRRPTRIVRIGTGDHLISPSIFWTRPDSSAGTGWSAWCCVASSWCGLVTRVMRFPCLVVDFVVLLGLLSRALTLLSSQCEIHDQMCVYCSCSNVCPACFSYYSWNLHRTNGYPVMFMFFWMHLYMMYFLMCILWRLSSMHGHSNGMITFQNLNCVLFIFSELVMLFAWYLSEC